MEIGTIGLGPSAVTRHVLIKILSSS
uniref:Uncharacterized protein n=1 Tax=Anguilla anguilla TaxID=7936 RepID=A0A0E9PIX1_ANGAN